MWLAFSQISRLHDSFPLVRGVGQGVRQSGGAVSVWMDLQSLWEFVLWSRLVSVWVRTCRVFENSSCGVGFALWHCIKVHQYGVMQFYIRYSVHNCKLFVNSEAMISPVLANLQWISPARTLSDGRIRLYSKLSQILALHSASTYFFCPHWSLRAECIPMLSRIVSHWLNTLWNICKVAFWKTLLLFSCQVHFVSSRNSFGVIFHVLWLC